VGAARLGQAGDVNADTVDVVCDLVDQVPAGRATTYGDLAAMASDLLPRAVTARAVGQVMARAGRDVPWWRVVGHDGRLPPGLQDEAGERLRREGCPMRAGRVDLSRARWPQRP
jgi:methylated-DNA-protein-cysteine methyltransferase-like protein